MNFRVSMTILSLGFLAVAFQNCSKTNFSDAEKGTYFKTQEIPDSGHVAAGDDGNTDDPLPSQNTPDQPDSQQHPEHQAKTPEDDESPQNSLVECELGSPSLKIKIGIDFSAKHSNDSSTRVCMSEHACLKLLNDYAASHSNSFVKGAETSPGNPAQCTKIFPGSKGTCHNAKVLSDEAISKILAEMGT